MGKARAGTRPRGGAAATRRRERPQSPAAAPASARDRLVETALRLFDRDGFRASGIDAVLAEAGVAKMTLYAHFASKDELIAAALELRDRRWREWFMAAVERRAAEPAQRLQAVFDVLEEWFNQPDFRGCLLINASSEFADRGHPARRLAADHRGRIVDYLRGLAAGAGAPDPAELAERIYLLIAGAIVAAVLVGDSSPARAARTAAMQLIAATRSG